MLKKSQVAFAIVTIGDTIDHGTLEVISGVILTYVNPSYAGPSHCLLIVCLSLTQS